MGNRWASAAVGVVGLAWLGAVAVADVHSDEELGFSINVPKDWRQIPIAGEEKYVVAKYQSDREYVDKKEGYSHRPDLKVVLFQRDAKKSATVETTDEGKVIHVDNPYKDFKDWVKSDAQGGRYISKEEEVQVGGLPTTWYEVKFEKLTVARRAIAFVYHASDVDYCAQYEVLEDQWDKLSPMLVQSLKSFKVFPRKGTVKRETTGDDVVVTDLSKLTPEERAKRRQAKFERDLKIATQRLPEGWSVKRSKNYVALTHVDDKFTAKVLEQAEAVRAWCEQTLGWIGGGTAGSEILRICKDSDEERAFTDTSSRSGWVQEITLARDDAASGLSWVNGRVLDAWLSDKAPKLASSMPPWLSQGLNAYVSSAYAKGGRLEFRPDGYEVVSLKEAAKSKTLLMPRQMLVMTYDDFMEKEKAAPRPDPKTGMGYTGGGPMGQPSGLVRFLLTGPGSRSPRWKDLFRTYVRNLMNYVEGEETKPGEPSAEPKTEEEEEKQFKERESWWKEHQHDGLKAVFDKTFSDWSDDDWAALEKAYAAFVA